jgi:RimJ/RimL family protein N-acetyltransferase
MPDRLAAGPVELVRWRAGMAADMAAAMTASFPALHRWMDWAAEVPTADGVRAVLEAGEVAFDADVEWQYALREADGAVVGCVGLHRRPGDWIELGYWVRSDRTGRGYATSAARALTEAAFAHLPDAEQVEIHMDRANVASAAVPPKIGYRLDREEDRPVLTPGHTGRGYVWVADRSTWAGRHFEEPSA